MRPVLVQFVLVLVLAACRTVPSSVPTAPPTVSAVTPRAPSGTAGWLAYIGGDGNVYVTRPGQEITIPITDDATVAAEGQGRSYHRLSWSPEGWLAFAAVNRNGNRARSQLYVARSPDQSDRTIQLVAENDQHFVIYTYWSPAACPGRHACRHLAYLIEEKEGVGLHLLALDVQPGQQQRPDTEPNPDTPESAVPESLDPITVGRPFYFAWSPDGRYLLSHTGGDRIQNSLARLALYDVARRHLQALPVAPGAFQAPVWSPDGSGWLAATPAGERSGPNQLQRFDAVSQRPVQLLNEEAPAEVSFAWSPDGQRVAYTYKTAREDTFYGPIYLYDQATGSTVRLTAPSFRVLGFFWAPDGERLAYLTQLDLPDATWMQWRVRELVTAGKMTDRDRAQDHGFAAFHPSPLMRFVIHSFNQYAQSHRFWSPDGRYLVFAERDGSLADHIWLVDTQNLEDKEPLPVAPGSLGFWSWR